MKTLIAFITGTGAAMAGIWFLGMGLVIAGVGEAAGPVPILLWLIASAVFLTGGVIGAKLDGRER